MRIEKVPAVTLKGSRRDNARENKANPELGSRKNKGHKREKIRSDRPPARDLDLMYKVQGNKSLSSIDDYDRKCERIRNNLSKLNIKMKEPRRPETNDTAIDSRPKKRFYPPLKLLPVLSIFKTSNKKEKNSFS